MGCIFLKFMFFQPDKQTCEWFEFLNKNVFKNIKTKNK